MASAIGSSISPRWVWTQIQFNEEWNSPHNIDLAKNDIDNPRYSFRSVIDENGRKYGTTSFVRIAGKGTLGEQLTAEMEIPDGPANTILFLLWIDSGIPWMKLRTSTF